MPEFSNNMQDCLNTLMNDADPYVDEIDQHCNVTTPARSSSLQAPQKPPSQALRSNTVHSYQYFVSFNLCVLVVKS